MVLLNHYFSENDPVGLHFSVFSVQLEAAFLPLLPGFSAFTPLGLHLFGCDGHGLRLEAAGRTDRCWFYLPPGVFWEVTEAGQRPGSNTGCCARHLAVVVTDPDTRVLGGPMPGYSEESQAALQASSWLFSIPTAKVSEQGASGGHASQAAHSHGTAHRAPGRLPAALLRVAVAEAGVGAFGGSEAPSDGRGSTRAGETPGSRPIT